MAFRIRIHEKVRFVYDLLSEHLRREFPDAYIEKYPDDNNQENGGSSAGSGSNVTGDGAVDMVIDLYDNDDYDICAEECSIVPNMIVPMRADHIISVSGIVRAIKGLRRNDAAEIPGRSEAGSGYGNRIRLILPFAYIDERERFIDRIADEMTEGCEQIIRIDLMSSVRMDRDRFRDFTTQTLTDLLIGCLNGQIESSEIPLYLQPDRRGFLSCGIPRDPDEIFDIGIDACAALMHSVNCLLSESDYKAVVVAEGWRMNEMIRLVNEAGRTDLLFPGRMDENGGMEQIVRAITRNAGGSEVTLHYSEDQMKSRAV